LPYRRVGGADEECTVKFEILITGVRGHGMQGAYPLDDPKGG
jgi:hypothetical protein